MPYEAIIQVIIHWEPLYVRQAEKGSASNPQSSHPFGRLQAAEQNRMLSAQRHRLLLEKEEGLSSMQWEWHPLELCKAVALAGTSPSLGGDRNGFAKKMIAQLDLQDEKEIERRGQILLSVGVTRANGKSCERACVVVWLHAAPRDWRVG